MSLFASFNGGPSGQAFICALIGGGLTGVLIGGTTAFARKRFGLGKLFLSAVCAMIVSGLVLVAGNERGDGANFFLLWGLIWVVPLSGIIGVFAGIFTAGLVTVFKGENDQTTQPAMQSRDEP